jgi:hypothetical protein
MHLEHLDPTASLWVYRLAGDRLLVQGRRTSDHRAWQAADRERPLYLRLADLTEMDGTGTAVLTADWRERALAFANLYAPPAGDRRLALARAVPLSLFASEALVLCWALRLQACLPAGRGRSRGEAAKAALQIRALVPGVPESSVLVHPPDCAVGEAPAGSGHSPASLPPGEVQRRLRELHARAGSDQLWVVAANVFASRRHSDLPPWSEPFWPPSARPRLHLPVATHAHLVRGVARRGRDEGPRLRVVRQAVRRHACQPAVLQQELPERGRRREASQETARARHRVRP